MNAIRNIIQLTRPVNLLIVIITMLVVRYIVMSEIMDKSSIGMHFSLSLFLFVLLIVSVVSVTAAGNIINDYFDQKVDRINKPDKVVVGKKVKRRVAIVLHQALNIFGFVVSLIVCVATGYYKPILIPVTVITLLWFYSPVLKKKLFIGNFTVALCTASVPVWAAIFEIHELRKSYADLLVDPNHFFNYLWTWVLAMSAFAFLLTLIREAVKDLEDMQGDEAGEYHTIPLVYGAKKTKQYIFVLLTLFVLVAVAGISRLGGLSDYLWFAALILVPSFYTGYSIYRASDQGAFHRCSQLLKWMIVCGLVLLTILLQ